jgi:hypothetical protein
MQTNHWFSGSHALDLIEHCLGVGHPSAVRLLLSGKWISRIGFEKVNSHHHRAQS